ncbi:MAG: hypothetical protein QW837_09655 [Conexivisphaerales archaeon]
MARINPSKNLDLVGRLSDRINAKFVIIGFCGNSLEAAYFKRLRNRYPNLVIIPNAGEDVKQSLLRKAKIVNVYRFEVI